jgi:hypothetical protein
MAIIESIVLENGSGKIGNLVVYQINGQTVARSYVEHVNDLKSAAQLNNRAKMYNAVKSWQFLLPFFANINYLRSPIQTNYNAFVSLSKWIFETYLGGTPSECAAMLDQNSFGNSLFCIAGINDWTGALLRFNFDTLGNPYEINTFARMVTFNEVSGVKSLEVVEVLEADWTNGYVNFPNTPSSLGTTGTYIYKSDSSKGSTISFNQNL